MAVLSTRRMILLCIPVVIILFFLFSAFRSGSVTFPVKQMRIAGHKTETIPTGEILDITHFSSSEKEIGNHIATLYQLIKLPVTAKTYTDQNGKTFDTGGNVYWKEGLGKEILILDIDTRVPNKTNEIFSNRKMNWERVDAKNRSGRGLLSAAFINHFLYSQIHGYDYRYFHAQPIEGHKETWIKPHVLSRMLQQYKFVVFLDTDAIIQHLEVPMEFLFNRWNISQQTSIAMPLDTRQVLGHLFWKDKTVSLDTRGNRVMNTGVMIAQASPHTFKMLDAWKTCTDEVRYPGCAYWKENWSHEQRAFSEYIRYDFNPTGREIVELPCDDTEGYPGMKGIRGIIDDCQGQFVRHFTTNKPMTKGSTEDVLTQAMAEILQKAYLINRNEYFVEE